VFVSIATSSGDDLPRHIEFLYSRNRLNVAIGEPAAWRSCSRRRVVWRSAAPVEQMQPVNTLC
jgi:uncharacterized protein